MIYAPRDREVMNIITGRRLFMQGVRPFDLVQVALSMGLTNGGMLAREGIWKYTGAVPVMTGSAAQTPTRRQVELLQAWGAKFLIGFPAYLRHMALVARDEMNIDPATRGQRLDPASRGRGPRDARKSLGRRCIRYLWLQRVRHDGRTNAITRAECMSSKTHSCSR